MVRITVRSDVWMVKAVFRLGQFGPHFGPDHTWITSGSAPDQVRIIAGSLEFTPDHWGFGTAIPRILVGELSPFKILKGH